MSNNLVEGIRLSIHHTMLPVTDMDRSVDFYTRLLGMTLGERHTSEARKNEVGMVGYGAMWLELTRDTSENAPAAISPTHIHIGVDVDDLTKLCGILEQEGVHFVRSLRPTSDGKGLRAWIADPDGHQLELRG